MMLKKEEIGSRTKPIRKGKERRELLDESKRGKGMEIRRCSSASQPKTTRVGVKEAAAA